MVSSNDDKRMQIYDWIKLFAYGPYKEIVDKKYKISKQKILKQYTRMWKKCLGSGKTNDWLSVINHQPNIGDWWNILTH